MLLATLLLILTSGYVAFRLIKLRQTQGRLKYLGLSIATVLLALIQTFILINILTEASIVNKITVLVTEWGHVVCLALVLSSLALFIRESKPVFAQFPLLYTALPLLIIVSYLLVKDTYALKTWLLTIYQGGAIAVALLMYSVYTYRQHRVYLTTLTGAFIFMVTYILFWFIPVESSLNVWLWKVLASVALWVTVSGYEKSEALTSQASATQNTVF